MMRLSLISLLALLTAACVSTPETTLQADPPIGLADYGSYEWTETGADDPLSVSARAAVSRELGARGLAGAAQGDLAIAVSLTAAKAEHVTDFGDAFFVPGYGPHPGIHVPGAHPRYEVRAYTQGRLAIDIYDARAQRVLWRGVVAGPIEPGNEADVQRLAAALLARAER